MDSYNMSRGIVPGVIAGYVFLAFYGATAVPVFDAEGIVSMEINFGLLEAVSNIISADAFGGFILHFIISAVIGALYTGLFTLYLDLGSSFLNILVGGLIYGLIWWFVGANILLPILTGGSVLHLSIGPLFFGHVIFGHVLAFVVVVRDAALGMGYESLPKLKHPAGYNCNILDPETGLTKIGRTARPKERLRELQGEHGKQLRYSSLRESSNTPNEESRQHKKYATRRKDGEWFDLN